MKALTRFVGIGLLGGLSLWGPPSTLANLEVGASVQIQARADFEAPLALCGSWVEAGSYGRCWRPARVVATWRPYCDGSWVWTDCGWYWESDEPWAWACYHYGTWVYDSEFGWLWVPAIEWAPAWVHWRIGGGFIGWAPCPPQGVILAPRLFTFVAAKRFHEHIRPASVAINDPGIIGNTKEITEVRHAERKLGDVRHEVVITGGPTIEAVQEATGKKIPAVPVQTVVGRTPHPRIPKHEAAQTPDKAKSESTPETARPSGEKSEPPAKSIQPDDSPSKKEVGPTGERPGAIDKPGAGPRLRNEEGKKERHGERQQGRPGKGNPH